jgi:RHS repeat-associated protein
VSTKVTVLPYLVADALGSVRGVVSSAGSLTASTSYDAWGNLQTTGGLSSYTPIGFAGGYTDPTGLLYLINRYYDPSTGQFVSVDPMVNETNQPYAYAGDDPVNGVDPSGLDPTEILYEQGSLFADAAAANPGYFNYGSFADFAEVIHSAAKVVTAVAGACALFSAVVGAEPVAAACGGVAVLSAAVQVLSGTDLVATNNESWGQFGLDAASLGVSATGLGLARLAESLAESSAWSADIADELSWRNPISKAGYLLKEQIYSLLSTTAFVTGIFVELGGNALDWSNIARAKHFSIGNC